LTSPLSPDVRRKRLSEVRSELSAVMAQGSQASPAQVRALLDELELLTQGSLDPRYFQALRDMLEGSGKMQELNRELQRLASSTDPKDVARRQAISVELRVLSERISAAAADVQAYAHSPAVQGKAP
jgi:phage host-nuclease inhibitor protein Gam